jgi:hypothetical protein
MGDLSDDSLKFPAYLLVQLLNLLAILGWRLKLRSQASLEHALEKVHPWGDALRHSKEIWRDNKIIGREENLGDKVHY